MKKIRSLVKKAGGWDNVETLEQTALREANEKAEMERQKKIAEDRKAIEEQEKIMKKSKRSMKFFNAIIAFFGACAFVSLGVLFSTPNGVFNIVGAILYLVISILVGLGIYYSHFD